MTYTFIAAGGGAIPNGATPQGQGWEADREPLWVARTIPGKDAAFGNGIQLGKVRPGLGAAYFPWGGKEVQQSEYEVLVEPGAWASAVAGGVPIGAVVCGIEDDGQPLFVARAHIDGALHPGKLRVGFDGAHIGLGDREVEVSDYEILVAPVVTVNPLVAYFNIGRFEDKPSARGKVFALDVSIEGAGFSAGGEVKLTVPVPDDRGQVPLVTTQVVQGDGTFAWTKRIVDPTKDNPSWPDCEQECTMTAVDLITQTTRTATTTVFCQGGE